MGAFNQMSFAWPGFVQGIEQMGGTVAKKTDTHVFIDIKAGSDLVDKMRQQRLAKALMLGFDLGMKVRVVQ